MATFGTNELVNTGFIIIALLLIIPVFALIDIIRSQFRDSSNKTNWILIVILAPVIGGILYFILGVKQKISQTGF